VLFIGTLLSAFSLVLGINGWEISRLWLYLVASAMFILVGVQLIVYWILFRVLDELSQRELTENSTKPFDDDEDKDTSSVLITKTHYEAETGK
jgi:ABC-type nickel/cobalt efflux system permease component RcnA